MQDEEGSSQNAAEGERFAIQIVRGKGEKAFPAVVCPICGKWAHWQGIPSYTKHGRVMITYACVEDDGCGSIGSRPLRESEKV